MYIRHCNEPNENETLSFEGLIKQSEVKYDSAVVISFALNFTFRDLWFNFRVGSWMMECMWMS